MARKSSLDNKIKSYLRITVHNKNIGHPGLYMIFL